MQKLMLNTLKVKSSQALEEIKEVLEQLDQLSNAYIKLEYSANMNKRVKKALKQLNKVSDSKFLECVDEMATQITEMNFGEDTWVEEYGHGVWEEQSVLVFSEEAQDFYNDKFDEYETLINNTLNVWNKQTI